MITHLTLSEPMFEELLKIPSRTIQKCLKPKGILNGNHMKSLSAGNLRNKSKQSLFSRYVHIDCIEAAFRARGLL